MGYVIGTDFDNTIISYDELIYNIARSWNLIPTMCSIKKKEIRGKIRELPNGEACWQKIQAIAYGSQIKKAKLFEGVDYFFQTCRRECIPVFIVSHKTEYSAYDNENINLREAALQWMEDHQFFDPNGVMRLIQEQVYFESTRKQKINRIQNLGCTHFVDDLIETFQEPFFPKNIKKVLFSPSTPDVILPNTKVAASWQEIYHEFF